MRGLADVDSVPPDYAITLAARQDRANDKFSANLIGGSKIIRPSTIPIPNR